MNASASPLGAFAHQVERCLHQLDQDAFAAEGKLVVALGVNEADVVTGGAFANATGSEAKALFRQPRDRCAQVVDPQADVVQRRNVNTRALLFVERLHEIDLDGVVTLADREDVFVDVLALALEAPGLLNPKQLGPQMGQARLVGAADRDLLDSKDLKRSLHVLGMPSRADIVMRKQRMNC